MALKKWIIDITGKLIWEKPLKRDIFTPSNPLYCTFQLTINIRFKIVQSQKW